MKLNEKQKRFCEEYVIDLNATQASIRAGYSKKTARTISSEHLTKPNIQSYIAELQVEISAKTGITIENTVKFIKDVSEEAREGGDATNALKGADLLMKHLGGYEKDNTQSSVTIINSTNGKKGGF